MLVFAYYYLSLDRRVAGATGGDTSSLAYGERISYSPPSAFSSAAAALSWRPGAHRLQLIGAGLARRFAQAHSFPCTPADLRIGRAARCSFPLILDDYVIREFLANFAMVLVTFVLLMLVFSFFELLGDIIRNRTRSMTVGPYLVNLIPYMVYPLMPLGVLVAVLVTFGMLNPPAS